MSGYLPDPFPEKAFEKNHLRFGEHEEICRSKLKLCGFVGSARYLLERWKVERKKLGS